MTTILLISAVLLFLFAALFAVSVLSRQEWVSSAVGCPWQASRIIPNRCGLCGNPYYEHVVRGRS